MAAEMIADPDLTGLCARCTVCTIACHNQQQVTETVCAYQQSALRSSCHNVRLGTLSAPAFLQKRCVVPPRASLHLHLAIQPASSSPPGYWHTVAAAVEGRDLGTSRLEMRGTDGQSPRSHPDSQIRSRLWQAGGAVWILQLTWSSLGASVKAIATQGRLTGQLSQQRWPLMHCLPCWGETPCCCWPGRWSPHLAALLDAAMERCQRESQARCRIPHHACAASGSPCCSGRWSALSWTAPRLSHVLR